MNTYLVIYKFLGSWGYKQERRTVKAVSTDNAILKATKHHTQTNRPCIVLDVFKMERMKI